MAGVTWRVCLIPFVNLTRRGTSGLHERAECPFSSLKPANGKATSMGLAGRHQFNDFGFYFDYTPTLKPKGETEGFGDFLDLAHV